MLFISLFFSAVMLVFANWFVYRRSFAVARTIAVSLLLAVGPMLMMLFLTPVVIQGLLTALAVIAWRSSGRRPVVFLRLSCGIVLLAYGFAGRLAWQSEQEYARLRRLYPYESMERRLPAPKLTATDVMLAPAAVLRLDKIERSLNDGWSWMRRRQLEMLHEEAVSSFVNSPGFGVARMLVPSEQMLALRDSRRAIPQPGPRVASRWSPGERLGAPAGDETFLGLILEDSVSDFVFSHGWGFIKDRRHVAGFAGHRFTNVPAPSDGWRIQDDLTDKHTKLTEPGTRWAVRTLDLVSLLLHEEPVAYVSEHLPAMDEARDAPTRPLDRFEGFGLAALRAGTDLFVGEDGDGLRMLGGIRSTAQCITCHGCRRGDLLGAFSYTLKRPEEKTDDDAQARASLSGLRTMKQAAMRPSTISNVSTP
jgi:hypothetical protein